MQQPEKVRNIIKRTGYNKGLKKLEKEHRIDVVEDILTTVEDLAFFKIKQQKSNHPLNGNLKGYKDIHIRGNVILIYRYVKDELYIDLELKDITDHDFGLSKNRK